MSQPGVSSSASSSACSATSIVSELHADVVVARTLARLDSARRHATPATSRTVSIVRESGQRFDAALRGTMAEVRLAGWPETAKEQGLSRCGVRWCVLSRRRFALVTAAANDCIDDVSGRCHASTYALLFSHAVSVIACIVTSASGGGAAAQSHPPYHHYTRLPPL